MMIGYMWTAKMKGKSQVKYLQLEWLEKYFFYSNRNNKDWEERGRHAYDFMLDMLLRYQGDVQKSSGDDLYKRQV